MRWEVSGSWFWKFWAHSVEAGTGYSGMPISPLTCAELPALLLRQVGGDCHVVVGLDLPLLLLCRCHMRKMLHALTRIKLEGVIPHLGVRFFLEVASWGTCRHAWVVSTWRGAVVVVIGLSVQYLWLQTAGKNSANTFGRSAHSEGRAFV